jgi:hypothetical protein
MEESLNINENDNNANTVLGNALYFPELVYKLESLNIDNFGAKTPITTYPGMGQFFIPVFETEE